MMELTGVVGMPKLSILIPARNEEYLANTIADLVSHIEDDTDIICVLDGNWPYGPIPDYPNLTLIYHPESIGQRAAINEAAKVSTSKYIMKLDAHCAVAQGFDRILLEDMQEDITVAPIMRNLHVFDWVCQCGYRIYQGPTPDKCPQCGQMMEKEIVWVPKKSPNSKAYCFDSTPKFGYFQDYEKRVSGDLTETMSFQGSCFVVNRERFLDLNMCDESVGSWGSQGIEIACKSWLSGGRCLVNHRTWYAHLFRTRGGDFGFPYPLKQVEVEKARAKVRELFFENKWEHQIKPLSWLLEKFWPIPGWTDEEFEELRERKIVVPAVEPTYQRVRFNSTNGSPRTGVVYYTDNCLPEPIMLQCKEQLLKVTKGLELVTVSLQPLDFGKNIVLNLKRGYLTMFKQILVGLEHSQADIIFFAEHDVLYHRSHFLFIPPKRSKIFYNTNVWHLRIEDGHGLYYTAKRTSQLCAKRDLLIDHYRKRIELVECNGFSYKMGFEPGTHQRKERVDDLEFETWMSEGCNVDVRHRQNLTKSRWTQLEFRNKNSCLNWKESNSIPGWEDIWHLLKG